MDEDLTYPSRAGADGPAAETLGPAPSGGSGETHGFLAGVRVLWGALGLMSGVLMVALWLLNAAHSLGDSRGFRQAAIALSFAGVAVPFLLWSASRPEADRRWLRLRPPRRQTWPVLVRAAMAGAAGILLLGWVASHLPGYVEAMAKQRRLGAWHGPAELAWALGCLAVVPALTEELYFRGYLLDRLGRAWGNPPGALVQAALFASLHGPAWPVAAGLGVLNAYLTVLTGSLWPGIVLHLLNNAVAVLALKM